MELKRVGNFIDQKFIKGYWTQRHDICELLTKIAILTYVAHLHRVGRYATGPVGDLCPGGPAAGCQARYTQGYETAADTYIQVPESLPSQSQKNLRACWRVCTCHSARQMDLQSNSVVLVLCDVNLAENEEERSPGHGLRSVWSDASITAMRSLNSGKINGRGNVWSCWLKERYVSLEAEIYTTVRLQT